MEKVVNRKKELRKEKRIPFESYTFYFTEHELYEGEIKNYSHDVASIPSISKDSLFRQGIVYFRGHRKGKIGK